MPVKPKAPVAVQAISPIKNPPTCRGLRIQDAADYSGLSPFYIEEQIRLGNLLSIGGPGSGVSQAHVVLREHLDKFLNDLINAAEERAEERRRLKGKAA